MTSGTAFDSGQFARRPKTATNGIPHTFTRQLGL